MINISAKDVNFYYGSFHALKNITLGIERNTVTAFIGPSGCGKSTFLRLLNRMNDLIEGTRLSGEIRIDGEDIYGRDVEVVELRKKVGMVFQKPNPFPKTIYENVAYGLRVNGVRVRRLIDERVESSLKGAALWDEVKDKLKTSAFELSGGQQQRLCIARALAVRPSILLMDEPLSNLDAKLRNQMRAEIIKLRQKINTTFLYVTHDQTEAMTLGDRIVIMKDGFIQQIGTPQEVFDHPANLFVAGFIGTPQMNFFDAELVGRDGHYAVVLDGMTVELSENKQQRLAAKGVAGQHVTLGVRPQHISLQCESGSVKARMDVFEMMGSEIHLHANVNGRDMVIIVPTTDINGNYSDAFTIGKEIDFSFSGSTCHLFGNDGKNLEF